MGSDMICFMSKKKGLVSEATLVIPAHCTRCHRCKASHGKDKPVVGGNESFAVLDPLRICRGLASGSRISGEGGELTESKVECGRGREEESLDVTVICQSHGYLPFGQFLSSQSP